MPTQLEQARAGVVTPQILAVAKTEDVDAQSLRAEVAQGRVVIPANRVHIEKSLKPAGIEKSLKPAGIGRLLSTKINANIGTSTMRSSIDEEISKMNAALNLGADAIMDLSTGGDLDKTRQELINNCPAPFGTVPVYQVIVDRDVEDVDYKTILKVVETQAKQGVDFFTIHAGLLREHLPLLKSRTMGIVSRGGALMAKWMLHHNKQNPLFELFDELCDIMRQYDVCFSLGDGLRPGCIADATDAAQIAELRTLGELTERAWAKGCQVMVEGPGHVPFNQIQYNMELQQRLCKGAPFYVLGPLVTDIAPGYDHITSAIGGVAAGYYGASFLCYVTPREHLGLPDADDVRQGVIASKIAAHAADIARGFKNAQNRDRELSLARGNLDWETHLKLSIDPETARRMHIEACKNAGTTEFQEADYCSMCGKNWCSVRINKEIRNLI